LTFLNNKDPKIKIMKKILTFLFVMVAAINVNAQTNTVAPVAKNTVAKVKQVQNPAAYACPKCFEISKGAGKCAHCGIDKVQLGTYYCYKCQKSTGTKPGPCPVCKGETVQITRKYCAQHKIKVDTDKTKS
jgi:hypothetical protein